MVRFVEGVTRFGFNGISEFGHIIVAMAVNPPAPLRIFLV
jgi:hypothetical protein